MGLPIWKMAATRVATYIRQEGYTFKRGFLLVPRAHNGLIVAWVFGNDDYQANEAVRRELDVIRQRLKETAVKELGFGLSPDGHTWVLALQADLRRFRTDVGRAFHLELVKAWLDEAVHGNGNADVASLMQRVGGSLEECQPTG